MNEALAIATAQRRAEIVQEIERRLRRAKENAPTATTKDLLSLILNQMRTRNRDIPSSRTYWRWRGLWKAGGASALVMCARGGSRKKSEFTEAAYDFFTARYFKPGAEASKVYALLKVSAQQNRWTIPSLSTILRRCNERIPVREQEKLRREVRSLAEPLRWFKNLHQKNPRVLHILRLLVEEIGGPR